MTRSLIKLTIFFLCSAGAVWTMPSVAATCDQNVVLKGVNIAGAEFNAEHLPGILFKNYIYPNNVELDYFASIGATVIRLPFLWERIQPMLFGELAPTELQNIATAVALAKSNGMCVILDVHNYGGYRGKSIGSTQVSAKAFIDLWSRLAEQFGDASTTAFDLMNEPFNLSVDQWASIAQQTVNAIRKQGAKNVILVAGGRWSGVHDWFSDASGVSNAHAFAAFHDSEQRTLKCISMPMSTIRVPDNSAWPLEILTVCSTKLRTGRAPMANVCFSANSACPQIINALKHWT